MGKTRLAAELAREVRAQGGEVRYVNCIGHGPAAAALADARCDNDARPARPRRSGRRGPGAPRRRATRRSRCFAHAGTRARYLTNGIPGCSTPGAQAARRRCGRRAGRGRSRARPPCRFRSRPCSTRPRACRSRFKRSLRSGFAPRPAAASRKLLSARQPAGKSCGPPRRTSRVAWSTSSRLSTESTPTRGRRASLSVQGPGELRRRRCRHVLRARAARRRARRAPAGSDAARRGRAVGKRQVVDRASRALRRPREWRAPRLGGVGAGRHSTGRASARRAGSGAAQPNGREALARHRSARGGLHALPRRGRAHAVPRRAHAPAPRRNGCHRRQGRLLRPLAPSARSRASSPRTTSWSAR